MISTFYSLLGVSLLISIDASSSTSEEFGGLMTVMHSDSGLLGSVRYPIKAITIAIDMVVSAMPTARASHKACFSCIGSTKKGCGGAQC